MSRAVSVAVWPLTRAEGTAKVYFPSWSVRLPMLMPSRKTLAELSGAPASLVTRPLIVVLCCATANAGSNAVAHAIAMALRTKRPILPPCHLFQKVCRREHGNLAVAVHVTATLEHFQICSGSPPRHRGDLVLRGHRSDKAKGRASARCNVASSKSLEEKQGVR